MPQAVLRRKGRLLEISADGVVPLPTTVYDQLTPRMRYTHTKHLYGRDIIISVDPETGKKRITRVLREQKRLYRFDKRERLVCNVGYLDFVYATLRSLDYEIGLDDLTPYRDAALTPVTSRLARFPEFSVNAGDAAELAAILDAGGAPPTSLVRRVKQAEIAAVIDRRISRRLYSVEQLPPGVGKSYSFAAMALRYPKAKIAVVVPGQDNFYKTVKHLMRFMGSIGQVGFSKSTKSRVTVYSMGSLHHVEDDVDIMIVDEVHMAMADNACAALNRVAPNAIRIGFTATPQGRMDGTDARMEGLFGPVAYRMTWPEATALGLIVPIEVRWLACDFRRNPAEGLSGIQRKKRGIWANDDRNALIARYARKHENDQVLIMVEKIEHALRLGVLLPEFSLVYGQQDVAYFEKWAAADLVSQDFVPVDREMRETMRRRFENGELRKVIATDVWATGVSFDALQVMFRADGRGSPILDEQIPGRASRVHEASSKSSGIIYDCDDAFDAGLGGIARRRRANYGEKGWQQSTLGRASHLAR